MEEFCSGMPPSYSQLKQESAASHIAAAGRLKDGDEAASKPEFRLPLLPARTQGYFNNSSLSQKLKFISTTQVYLNNSSLSQQLNSISTNSSLSHQLKVISTTQVYLKNSSLSQQLKSISTTQVYLNNSSLSQQLKFILTKCWRL